MTGRFTIHTRQAVLVISQRVHAYLFVCTYSRGREDNNVDAIYFYVVKALELVQSLIMVQGCLNNIIQ